ncbi:Ribonuclease Oy [Trichoplax sp. H2]|nr:Ribonuclease Oy [Trichoplax sp. H2]|eukprot:RDD40877.1 Ribonuclease Oy [Trichoplax sp. H2]
MATVGKTLAAILLCCLVATATSYKRNTLVNRHHSHDHSWDYLLFVREWPAVACMSPDAQRHDCSVPNVVHNWTIHGLWPTKEHTEGPNYCNDDDKFDVNKIKSLIPMLDRFWPNLYSDESPSSFWKHEWTKHGTCAMSLAALGDELKFFSTTLKLNKKFNIDSALYDANIVPSDNRQYMLSDIKQAIGQQYNTEPIVDCLQGDNGQYLFDIRICIDKEFQARSCDGGSSHECDGSQPIRFPPIHNGTAKFIKGLH